MMPVFAAILCLTAPSVHTGLDRLIFPPTWAANGACVLVGTGSDRILKTIRIEPNSTSVQNLPDSINADPQQDCEQGLFAIGRRDGVHVFNVANGKELATLPIKDSSWRRVGGLILTNSKRVYDARTGRDLGSSNYDVIWDGPTRRFAFQSVATEGQTCRLTELKPGTLEPLREVGVGRVEREFSGIVGNPERGPILLDFTYVGVGVEAISYEVVTTHFKLSPLTLTGCWGGNGQQILASNDNGYPTRSDTDRYQDLVCYDQNGKKQWTKKFAFGEFKSAEWVDGRVFVHKKNSDAILDPKTGNRTSVQPKSKGEVYRNGRWALRFDGKAKLASIIERK